MTPHSMHTRLEARIQLRIRYLTMIDPGPGLAELVRGYYVFHGDHVPPSLRMWPDGQASLWFHFGNRPAIADPVGSWPDTPIGANGPLDRSVEYRFPQSVDSINVLFKPGGAGAFFTSALHELNRGVHGPDVLQPALTRIYDSLSGAGLAQRIALLDNTLTVLARSHDGLQPWLATGLQLAQDRWGLVSIPDLSRTVNYSASHLRRAFKSSTGLSPKQLFRRFRFMGLLLHVNRIHQPDWAELALIHGYYDQAHLANEFAEFSTLTPREFIRIRDNERFFQEHWSEFEQHEDHV